MNALVPTRPALRYHGGKWLLAPWIIDHFPPHRIYVEPFGGAASVLIRKPPSYAEIYNDLDHEIVDYFRVLRDPEMASALVRGLTLTPFARAEFDLSYERTDDRIERARRLVIRSFMGFGAIGTSGASTGFRSNSSRSGSTPASDWSALPEAVWAVAERFGGVVIENRSAVDVMRKYDSAATLHYVDPPYLPETRGGGNPYCAKHQYRHELTFGEHAELLDVLRGLTGMVLLSGYPSDLYDAALADWRRVERRALADGARERTEVLWINPAAAAALDQHRAGPLFGGGAP